MKWKCGPLILVFFILSFFFFDVSGKLHIAYDDIENAWLSVFEKDSLAWDVLSLLSFLPFPLPIYSNLILFAVA